MGSKSETSRDAQLVVMDDDPTGSQLCTDVKVLLQWDRETVENGLRGASTPVHISTNSRGVSAEEARRRVADATRAVVSVDSGAQILLRGDSTLRGHVREEYEGLCEGVGVDDFDSLLLVPALPSAGRFTIGGVQWVGSEGALVPVGDTEYARDRSFGFRSSSLLAWLEERSAGKWRASNGVEVSVSQLRTVGPEAVSIGIERAASDGGGCVPDAVTMDDLEIIRAGMERAAFRGVNFATRCGPAFAAVVGRSVSADLVEIPGSGAGVLVVVGSYVPKSTRQLDRLKARYPYALFEPSVELLLDEASREGELDRLAVSLGRSVAAYGIGVVATPRVPEGAGVSVRESSRVADALADVIPRIDPRPGVVVAKGGVTAAVTISRGLGAATARVRGPVAPGIGLWEVQWSDTHDLVDVVVFPGNVGSDETLEEVVKRLMRS